MHQLLFSLVCKVATASIHFLNLFHALQRELALFFNDLIAANRAAVAPGPAVSDRKLLRGSRGVALLELRCSVEASNCMAFDGVHFKMARLMVSITLVGCFQG